MLENKTRRGKKETIIHREVYLKLVKNVLRKEYTNSHRYFDKLKKNHFSKFVFNFKPIDKKNLISFQQNLRFFIQFSKRVNGDH